MGATEEQCRVRINLYNRIREAVWKACTNQPGFPRTRSVLWWVTLTTKIGTVSGKPGWLVTSAERDFWGSIWGSYCGRENSGKVESCLLGLLHCPGPAFPYLSNEGGDVLFCFLTGCWNGKWEDCWGRCLPGITCVLSARNDYFCRGTVIHHSLKESPHSSRSGFSESITSHTAEFLNPTARDIFHRCKNRSARASSPREA